MISSKELVGGWFGLLFVIFLKRPLASFRLCLLLPFCRNGRSVSCLPKARCLLNNPLYIPPIQTKPENSTSTESSTVAERIEDACQAEAVDDVSILCFPKVGRSVASTLIKALDEKTIRSYSYNLETGRLTIHTMARSLGQYTMSSCRLSMILDLEEYR